LSEELRAMKQHYKDLIVWQKAIALVTQIYRCTGRFPREEMYGLVSQMRRAAVSVACNIAEGQGRLTRGEFRHFLGMAKGSLLELETQLIIGQQLNFVEDAEPVLTQLAEVARLLNGLLNSLTTDN
jgi:four helix bundle protein